ncbi:Dolichyl-diphosphooligosaccharide-protein glycosyltransferase 48kDa subunit [Trichoderma longibrachiatum]|uniref:Dolichyl-diphosphooligosaccharide--protein glycosyltransferase subunit WBP1 n=1 Tax=Trichoderma longibrachiatum ATCC 18648 TaxID=983965 RepID=A0A2T4BTX3_TRILO|nr:Dolichyl-diphosphooligosaccharide-protein glycosyltransferase 48kDa subunit [Trichoderma longibrachiatum ATCC 18648]
MWSILSVAAALFAAAVSAVSTSGNRLLVVLDDVAEKEAYGQFLGDLTARGYQVSYETPRSEGLTLFHLGERTYDHLLFLPSKVKGLGPNLTPNRLVDFVNANGNILVALSSKVPTSTSLVSLLSELDISLPVERTGTVVDHFNYDTISAAESHDVLVLDAPSNIRPGLKPYFELPGGVLAFPHAVGHVLGSGPLLTPVVRAPATAYSYNPKEQAEVLDADELFAAGQQLALVSVMQARNSARVTVLGSAEMLQDKWLDAKVAKLGGKSTKTENKEFARRVAGWTFQEIGVLRVNSVEHHLQGSEELNPGIYRVKNDVSYTISLSEYVWDKWVPFVLPEDDLLQLEFSMLSPFHRLNLELTGTTDDAAIYGVSFTLPDQHGIFNFLVNYKRSFLSNVEEKNTVSVRHFAHDEWPRSFVISGAWPWISGIGATVTGFLGFCAIWMYSKPVGKKN